MGTISDRLAQWLDAFLENAAPGTPLPTDCEIAMKLGISLRTVRRIMKKYAMDGKIERIWGKGSYMPGGPGTVQSNIRPRKTSSALVADALLHLVHTGHLREGKAFPPLKSICYQYHVSADTVRKAYQRLVSRGYALRVGKRYWVITPDSMTGHTKKSPVWFYRADEVPYHAIFDGSESSTQYSFMESELHCHGHVIHFSEWKEFPRHIMQWRKRRVWPRGLFFHGVDADSVGRIMDGLQELAGVGADERPRVVLEWLKGLVPKLPSNVLVYPPGNFLTQRARMLAHFISQYHFRSICGFFPPPDTERYEILRTVKLWTAIRALRYRCSFHTLVLARDGADSISALVDNLPQQSSHFSEILNKYEHTSFDEFKQTLIPVATDSQAARLLKQADLWLFSRDADAARWYGWAQNHGIAVPGTVSILSFENNPAYFHLGLSTCTRDSVRTGYVLAHALIGDIPVERTAKGFIRTYMRLIERGTTKCPARTQ